MDDALFEPDMKGPVTLTDEVIESFGGTKDERLKQIMSAVVRHCHELVREIGLTQAEWEHAINFLTQVGKKCDDVRQEFVLLSDVLGVSMLVELINSTHDGVEENGNYLAVDAMFPTESTVLGPFHMTESPRRAEGDVISVIDDQPLVVEVLVRDRSGKPIPRAIVDVWQCNSKGFYDVQQPEIQASGNGRGLFTANDDGELKFVTVAPSHYPIPTDGPVGSLLVATGRHPFRPAHIHFLIKAAGHRSLTTHIFISGSPYLESDAVFAVKTSLICEIEQVDASQEANLLGIPNPFQRTRIQLVLEGGESQ